MPGTVSNTPFNHISLLKTLEDIFDTDAYGGARSVGTRRNPSELPDACVAHTPHIAIDVDRAHAQLSCAMWIAPGCVLE